MESVINKQVPPLYKTPTITKFEERGGIPNCAVSHIRAVSNKTAGMLCRPYPYCILKNIQSISACVHNNAAIDNDSVLWSWGATSMAQLENGVFTSDMPQAVDYIPKRRMENVQMVSAGAWHTLYITKDKKLWGWGENSNGELGVGDFINRQSPICIMSDVEFVYACECQTFVVKSDTSLWGWGLNINGHLFDAPESCHTPVRIMDSVKYVCAGEDAVMVIKDDNSLWGWGNNLSNVIFEAPISGICKPTLLYPGVRSVSLPASDGDSYCLFVTEKGELFSIGTSDDAGAMVSWKHRKQEGNGPIKVMENVEKISTGHGFTLIQLVDGRLYAMGRNELGQCGIGKSTSTLKEPMFILSGTKASAGGHFHGMGLQTNGDLWIWGGDYGIPVTSL